MKIEYINKMTLWTNSSRKTDYILITSNENIIICKEIDVSKLQWNVE